VPDVETPSRINREHFVRAPGRRRSAVIEADIAVQQVRTQLEQLGIAGSAWPKQVVSGGPREDRPGRNSFIEG